MDGALSTTSDPNQPRAVDGGRGVAWWTDAWALFMKNAVIWVVLGLVLILILFVLAIIPLVGQLASALLMPVFGGSWMMAAKKLEDGGTLEVGDLFGAFKSDRMTPLMVVGALFLVAMVIIVGIMGVLGFGGAVGMMAGGMMGSSKGFAAGMGVSLFAMLVGLVLFMLVTMALWFAPPLVALRGVAPMDAMRLSFAASMKNVVPFLLWGIIYIIASIIASIPFGLGWLVLAPVLLLTVYTSYKDVFGG
ncbi:MAG TPA: BPSS1780 family membrane protein [Burkholderiaceae bacterium]|nr:BPSS1780 family membrane protein [Burkholderiaceae bacterium]